MNVSITDAKAQLPELVRRAEGGETVVLTRHGHPAVELKPVAKSSVRELTPEEKEARYRAIMDISRRAAAKATPGPDAAHSADYLYDENGLPI
jgi:prevent-host-death family protein